MGAVTIGVTAKVLERLLELPEGQKITGAGFESLDRIVILRVDGDGLPGVLEGATPELVPVEDLERMRVLAQRRSA